MLGGRGVDQFGRDARRRGIGDGGGSREFEHGGTEEDRAMSSDTALRKKLEANRIR